MTRPYEACNYIDFDGRKYLYLNDDSPVMGYQTKDISFVAQPLPYSSEDYNVIPVPLMMTDEWEIIQSNPTLISELRTISGCKQTHTFNFIGQTGYVGREIFRNLDIEDYVFVETGTVYSLDKEDKRNKLIKFLYEIASSIFTFAPRGIGSSSFRAYQAMMVGSIPIITGMNDYPFKDEVNWDEICIRGDLKDINTLIEKALNMTWEERKTMRGRMMLFWDNYCKHDSLYNKLKEKV